MSEVLWNVRLLDLEAGVAAERKAVTIDGGLVTAIDAGLSPGEAARLFGVDLSTVYRWRRRARRGEPFAEKLVMSDDRVAWARGLLDRLGQ